MTRGVRQAVHRPAGLSMPGELSVSRVRALGRVVTDWGTGLGHGSRRPELPWRETRDPWAVLVSEVMAQQTQVARVVPVYRRFLTAYPTPRACAAAPLGDVVRAWRGLGYNRRARNLHRAAEVIVIEHGGRVPERLEDLMALPGVGGYTARAVLAFAFEVDVGVVDTNAGRVAARAVAGRSLRPTEAQEVVDAMVPAGEAWAFGQALLDLGATVCDKRTPRCDDCPLHRRCRWGRAGRPQPDPAIGSAGVSVGQTAFEGSDRQGRGRLIDALRAGAVHACDAADVMGWAGDAGRSGRVVDALIGEGLVCRDATGRLHLP